MVSRHDLKVVCSLVRRRQASPVGLSGYIFVNTAGHIPKEVVSINSTMVRAHTFDIGDFERIIVRPVRPLSIFGPAPTYLPVRTCT